MTDKTIQQILDAFNNHKLATETDIEDYARKHRLRFEDVLQCIANNNPDFERCWKCKHIANRYYPKISSPCDNCSRRAAKDNYETCDIPFRKKNRPKKIPGTPYTDLRSLLPNTRFRVENGNWCGRIMVKKDGGMYFRIDGKDKLFEVTGKEDLIITILN